MISIIHLPMDLVQIEEGKQSRESALTIQCQDATAPPV